MEVAAEGLVLAGVGVSAWVALAAVGLAAVVAAAAVAAAAAAGAEGVVATARAEGEEDSETAAAEAKGARAVVEAEGTTDLRADTPHRLVTIMRLNTLKKTRAKGMHFVRLRKYRVAGTDVAAAQCTSSAAASLAPQMPVQMHVTMRVLAEHAACRDPPPTSCVRARKGRTPTRRTSPVLGDTRRCFIKCRCPRPPQFIETDHSRCSDQGATLAVVGAPNILKLFSSGKLKVRSG